MPYIISNAIQSNTDQTITEAYCSVISLDIEINENQLTIPGNSFTPPIIKFPVNPTAAKFDGTNGEKLDIVNGFVKNGDYYDILISPQIEAITDVTITVIQ